MTSVARSKEIGGDTSLVPDEWTAIVGRLTAGNALRRVQAEALAAGLLSSRKNFLISAPTNAGKSLIGTLVLLEAVKKGRRAILLEPLRALAREQAETLQRLTSELKVLIGQEVSVRLSTGDYRLDAEEFSDPAPGGELIVATPERLEAILRNPENKAWLDTVGAVCVDEAHLISSPRRGPTLEFLITSLLSLAYPPRLVLLSATLGNTDVADEWLRPCRVVKITERYPPLRKEVLELTAGDSANEVVGEWLSGQLEALNSQALVFVYQTRSTESLARELTEQLGKRAGDAGAVAYHAQMSTARREQARQAFLSGKSRVLVTTSALAMGVNLPATHVVVRDLTYPGAQSPNVADILQMMGRAGRGDQEGHAVVVKRPGDDWTTLELQQALDREELPDFRSAVIAGTSAGDGEIPTATVAVSSLLSRYGASGRSRKEIEAFLQNSLGARELVSQVGPALRWLENQALAFDENGQHRLTVLGERAAKAVLPLPLATGYAQLIRDLLSVDPDDKTMGQWKPLDHLLILQLLHDRVPSLRRFSERLSGQVTGWCEGAIDQAPVLFRRWIDGEKGHSKAAELLGSLGLSPGAGTRDHDEWARREGYLATFRSIVLFERGHGRSVADLNRRFEIENLEGLEERWRDDLLWLLSGIAKLLEIRTFYYHLREECDADSERIKRVKRLLGRMRHQTYELQEQLKYCSALGPVLHDIRKLTGGGVGEQTIRTLEQTGITDLKGLYAIGFQGMVERGVRRDIAKRIQTYLRRRAM